VTHQTHELIEVRGLGDDALESVPADLKLCALIGAVAV
jgi:hypothetical protein